MVAFECEMIAKCIVHNLRRLVILEELHDDSKVKFSGNWAFEPLPEEWYSVHKLDVVLDEPATVVREVRIDNDFDDVAVDDEAV